MLLLSSFFFFKDYKTEHPKTINQVTSSMHLQRANLFLSHPPLLLSILLLSSMTTAFTILLPEPCRAKGQSHSWEQKSLSFFFILSLSLSLRQHISVALKTQSSVHTGLFSLQAPYALASVARLSCGSREMWIKCFVDSDGMTASQSIILVFIFKFPWDVSTYQIPHIHLTHFFCPDHIYFFSQQHSLLSCDIYSTCSCLVLNVMTNQKWRRPSVTPLDVSHFAKYWTVCAGLYLCC